LDHIGTIAPGKQADLVVVKGDPSSEISDIEAVAMVFKDGVGLRGALLSEPRPIPMGTLDWRLQRVPTPNGRDGTEPFNDPEI
jgi:adenine deaminase